MKLKTTIVLAIPMLLAVCQGHIKDLPESNGPFAQETAKVNVRLIEQKDDQLSLPSSDTGMLAIRVQSTYLWKPIAMAIHNGFKANDETALIYVKDREGKEQVIEIPIQPRFTGPIIIPDTTDYHSRDNCVTIEIGTQPKLLYHNSPITPKELALKLNHVFQNHGSLFFPPNEQPNKAEMPITLEVDKDATLQNVVSGVSAIQSAGFPTVLVKIR